MRAQLTVFIILGIIILVAFAVVIYVAAMLTAGDVEKKQALQESNVKEYVESCLDTVTKQGLSLLGEQGGKLLVSQGGVTNDAEFSYAVYDSSTVGFGVTPPRGSFAQYYADPPRYPFANFPFVAGKPSFSGFYGFNRLSPMFKKSEGVFVEQSIQNSLESYIDTNLPRCVNWSSFPDDISEGERNVSVILASNTSHLESEKFVSVLLNWPINITNGDTKKLDTFAIKLPVRLASMHYFVQNMIDKDVSDISYEPESENFFDVKIEKAGADSVVIVEDTASELEGRPYKFMFARKNRRPALWYINFGRPVIHVGTDVSVSGDQLIVDDPCPVDEDNNPMVFDLQASDPDDDNVTFSVELPPGFAEDASVLPVSGRIIVSDGTLEDWQVVKVTVAECAD